MVLDRGVHKSSIQDNAEPSATVAQVIKGLLRTSVLPHDPQAYQLESCGGEQLTVWGPKPEHSLGPLSRATFTAV